MSESFEDELDAHIAESMKDPAFAKAEARTIEQMTEDAMREKAECNRDS